MEAWETLKGGAGLQAGVGPCTGSVSERVEVALVSVGLDVLSHQLTQVTTSVCNGARHLRTQQAAHT